MTKHLTVTLDETAAIAFGELSAQSGEPVNVLVNEVLAGWLDVRAEQLAAIRAGLAQLDRGDTVSHEEMERLAASYSAS